MYRCSLCTNLQLRMCTKFKACAPTCIWTQSSTAVSDAVVKPGLSFEPTVVKPRQACANSQNVITKHFRYRKKTVFANLCKTSGWLKCYPDYLLVYKITKVPI